MSLYKYCLFFRDIEYTMYMYAHVLFEIYICGILVLRVNFLISVPFINTNGIVNMGLLILRLQQYLGMQSTVNTSSPSCLNFMF